MISIAKNVRILIFVKKENNGCGAPIGSIKIEEQKNALIIEYKQVGGSSLSLNLGSSNKYTEWLSPLQCLNKLKKITEHDCKNTWYRL